MELRRLTLLLAMAGACFAQSAGVTEVALGSTPGATPTLTCNAGVTNFTATLNASITSFTFSCAAVASGSIKLCQPSSGGPYTAAFPSGVGFGTIEATANKCSRQTWKYDGATWQATGMMSTDDTTGPTGAAGPTGATGPTGSSGSGTGTINSGTVGQVAEYTASGTTIGPVGPGATTSVLHGNASGPGAFGAVVLTTDVSGVLPAANVAAALSATTSVNGTAIPSSGTLTQTIASGTAALGTGAIASGACASAVTVSASGVSATDDIQADFNADPTSTTGYSASTGGMLTVIKYPTSGNVNFKVCNNTAASVTPGAATLNYRVVR